MDNAILTTLLGLVAFLSPAIWSFNLDLNTARVVKGTKGSKFGFSVEQTPKWFYIGAPSQKVDDSTDTGAVFKCGAMRKRKCKRMLLINGMTNSTAGENPNGQDNVVCTQEHQFSPFLTCTVDKLNKRQCEEKGGSGVKTSCLVGLSVAVVNGGNGLMIASPGSWYFQREELKGTAAIPRYSSAMGNFDHDNELDYLRGYPNEGEKQPGYVSVYSKNFEAIHENITDSQIGSLFGSSLAVADLNGDRLDDVIVGAPLYKNTKGIATGRVYIYYQYNSQSLTKDVVILEGGRAKSRFGQAVSAIGDINQDGFNDLCVGAPYGGKGRKGAIYIYLGSRKGIINSVSQVIQASDVTSRLSAFGYSISAGIDQDGNSYPDVLVGAHASNRAVFFRARPVVLAFVSLKLAEKKVNLDNKTCVLGNGEKVVCLNIFTCVRYDGIGLPNDLYFDLEWVLDEEESDVKKMEQRAFFIEEPGSFSKKMTVKVSKDNTFCTSLYGYIKNDMDDKLSPIKTALHYRLNNDAGRQNSKRKKILHPILDPLVPTESSYTVHILRDCGMDDVCVPDLSILSYDKSTEKCILNRDEGMELSFSVLNKGEDAFNTKLFLDTPSAGVEYRTMHNDEENISISTCVVDVNNSSVCDLGNPFKAGSEFKFSIVFTVDASMSVPPEEIEFKLYANSSNPEQLNDYLDNSLVLTIPVLLCEPDPFNGSRSAVNTSQVTVDTSYVTVEPSHVTVEPSHVTDDSCQLTVEPSYVIDEPSHVTVEPSHVTVDASHVSVDASQGTVEPSNVRVEPSHVTVEPSHVTVEPSQVAVDTSQVTVKPSHVTMSVQAMDSEVMSVQESITYQMTTQTPETDLENTDEHSIALDGKASPKIFNAGDQVTDGRGRLITHTFNLRNIGGHVINETDLRIEWPSDDSTGHPALTVDGLPDTSDGNPCNVLLNQSLQTTEQVQNKETHELRCPYKGCTVIECLVRNLMPSSSYSITINSRLKVRRFLEHHRRTNEGMYADDYKFVTVAHAAEREEEYGVKRPQVTVELTTTLHISDVSLRWLKSRNGASSQYHNIINTLIYTSCVIWMFIWF